MTASLETFAKVRALHDSTTHAGEKAAAASRMEALARSAGITVGEALSRLDREAARPGPGAAWEAFADTFWKAHAAGAAADAPDAPSRRRGLPIYDQDKVECWRDVAEHCWQLDWIIPKAHGGRFLTKDERARLKTIARQHCVITNATADWIETVLARCDAARQSWRDRGKAGVRPDRKDTESDIEKAAEIVAAARRREASKLDTPEPEPGPEPRSRAQTMGDAMNEFFNRPEQRAHFAEQSRKRRIRQAEILARYGSVEAVYAETEREAALREACEPFVIWDRRPGYEGSYTLSGWDWIQGRDKVPGEVRRAVEGGWPLPQNVKAAWAEYAEADAQEGDRHVMHEFEHHPALWSQVRSYVLEDLLDTLPAASIGDMLARQSWMEHWSEIGSRNRDDEARLLATLRADIVRMGERMRRQDEGAVQNGHQGGGETPPPPGSPQPGAEPVPVQSGHPRRPTRAERHAAIRTLIADGHTDREVARRLGISPTTVGTIRKAQA